MSQIWYLWCRRTGRGDEATAKELADAYYAKFDLPAEQMSVSDRILLAFYRMVEGRDREAGELRESVAREEQNPAGGLMGMYHQGLRTRSMSAPPRRASRMLEDIVL